MILGLVSDTHGLLRDSAVRALGGSELILHAGDVGDPQILETLRKIAPVVPVRGNVDTQEWCAELPLTATVEADGVRIYVLHDVKQLSASALPEGTSIVVSGHSHKPNQTERDGILFVNPGSAGPRRFQLPIMVARLDLRRTPWRAEFVDVSKA